MTPLLPESPRLPGSRTAQKMPLPELTIVLHTLLKHSLLWHSAARSHVAPVGSVGAHDPVLAQ